MDLSWINGFGAETGTGPLSEEQVDALLDLAGHGAHDSGDRRNAPLACFLVGLRAGRDGTEPTPDEIRSSIG